MILDAFWLHTGDRQTDWTPSSRYRCGIAPLSSLHCAANVSTNTTIWTVDENEKAGLENAVGDTISHDPILPSHLCLGPDLRESQSGSHRARSSSGASTDSLDWTPGPHAHGLRVPLFYLSIPARLHWSLAVVVVSRSTQSIRSSRSAKRITKPERAGPPVLGSSRFW